MSLEEAEARAEELFPADVLSGLGDMNWKNRLESRSWQLFYELIFIKLFSRLAAMETVKSSLACADTTPGIC